MVKVLARTKLSLHKRMMLRLLGYFIARKIPQILRERQFWRIQDYTGYLGGIFRENILRFPWNKSIVGKYNINIKEFEYEDLKRLPITKKWPSVKPRLALTASVSTGTYYRKTIYYNFFDLKMTALQYKLYSKTIGITPAKTSLVISSGFDPQNRPFTSTLVGQVVEPLLGIKTLHLTHEEIDNKTIANFIKKHGPFDRILIFPIYLGRFKFHVDVDNLVHEKSMYLHTGTKLSANIFESVKEIFLRANVSKFEVVNLYGASEVGMIAWSKLKMANWVPEILEQDLILDSGFYTFVEYDINTGELGSEILTYDEIKTGRHYDILVTPVKSVFVPNYELGDVIEVIDKTPHQIKIKVVGRLGKPVEIRLNGRIVKAVEAPVAKVSGLSITFEGIRNILSELKVGRAYIFFDEQEKIVIIYTDKPLDKQKFLEKAIKYSETSSLITLLEHGYKLKNIHGTDAKPIMERIENITRKIEDIFIIPEES